MGHNGKIPLAPLVGPCSGPVMVEVEFFSFSSILDWITSLYISCVQQEGVENLLFIVQPGVIQGQMHLFGSLIDFDWSLNN